MTTRFETDNGIEAFAEEFEAGTVLFEEGDEGSEMYVIQSGEVEISRVIGGETKVLAKIPAGEFFGEMAILNDRPRSATARVIEPSRLLVINGDTFEAMLKGRTEIAVRLIKTMAGRLEQANKQIELLLVTDNTHRVVMALRQLAEGVEADPNGAVFLNVSVNDLADRASIPREELLDILQRLAIARLVVYAEEAGIDREGFVVPEVGRLLEFIEFLDLKDRFGPVDRL
jgi:CRP-like cAMP-binding protein